MAVRQYIILGIVILVVSIVAFIVGELLFIKYNGAPVEAPQISRQTQRLGTGPRLNYVIMGDSTSIGQGTDYEHSYAWQSAQHLANTHEVHLTNLGVSGARAKSVLEGQLGRVVEYKPDIVLLAVGANDATHFTAGRSIAYSLEQIVLELRRVNPRVQIIVTGCADMGAIPRFPWPAKQLAGLRTRQVNAVFTRLVEKYQLVFAPIAAQTGPAFRADPTLFAPDKFHPNSRGYALWTPVINEALDKLRHR